MKRCRWLSFLLAAAVLLTTGSAAGQTCATSLGSTYSRSAGVSIFYSGNFPTTSAISTAAEAWDGGCGNMAGQDYPFLQVGGGYSDQLYVSFQTGHALNKNCNNNTAYCEAEYSRATRDVVVYEYNGTDGTTPTPTSTTYLSFLVEHEFGHALGLGHDSCANGIMNTPWSLGAMITDDECNLTDQLNRVPDEPADNCMDPPWCEYSPIVIDMGGGDYPLSGLNDPVLFDINGDGRLDRIGWTQRRSRVAFLWLDRNWNGCVDDGRELFGNTLAKNGFEMLKLFDQPSDGDVVYGGNGDGVIDDHDAVWTELKLWIDSNHDGICSPDETVPIAGSGIIRISLDYGPSRRRDRYGNEFRYRSYALRMLTSGRHGWQPIYDVLFAHE